MINGSGVRRSLRAGFTLLELLIVISIIAVLAATLVPNFIGFDTDARLVTTKTNLDTIRTRINLYRSKEGKYPERLEDLVEKTYNDLGIEKPYLDQMPVELISNKEGNSEIENVGEKDLLKSDGGWVYLTHKAKVIVDWDQPLDDKWGKAKDQVPAKW